MKDTIKQTILIRERTDLISTNIAAEDKPKTNSYPYLRMHNAFTQLAI